MLKHNQKGFANNLVLALGFSVFLVVMLLVFGSWAFMSRQDYKNNVDTKISAAVKVAKQEEAAAKDKKFAEDEKSPLRTYNGPSELGNLQFSYPKTWSGYVTIDTGSQNNSPLIGYFYPLVVPSTDNTASRFALKVEVINDSYSNVVQAINNFIESSAEKGPPTMTPYAFKKVPKVIGTRLVGNLPDEKKGEMVIVPLRSQTIKISTEADQFIGDFENFILPNFSFTP